MDPANTSEYLKQVMETMEKHPDILKLSPFAFSCIAYAAGQHNGPSSSFLTHLPDPDPDQRRVPVHPTRPRHRDHHRSLRSRSLGLSKEYLTTTASPTSRTATTPTSSTVLRPGDRPRIPGLELAPLARADTPPTLNASY